MATYKVTDTELSSIANAIRTKGGTSSQLEFPSEFVSGIEDLPSGVSSSDNGKVVVNGELVAQTSRNVTQNGTYDTTTNNEVVVSVSGGGGSNKRLVYPPIKVSESGSTIKIRDGWIDGFDGGTYYFVPLDSQGDDLNPDWSQPFKICVVFKRTNTYYNAMVLFGSYSGFYNSPSIELSNNGNTIWCGFSRNGSSWTDSISINDSDGLNLQNDVMYKVTAEWDGTDYSVTVLDMDNNIEITKQITPVGAHYNGNYIEFSGINKSSNHCARYVRFFLPDMYISQNGTKIWAGSEIDV